MLVKKSIQCPDAQVLAEFKLKIKIFKCAWFIIDWKDLDRIKIEEIIIQNRTDSELEFP